MPWWGWLITGVVGFIGVIWLVAFLFVARTAKSGIRAVSALSGKALSENPFDDPWFKKDHFNDPFFRARIKK